MVTTTISSQVNHGIILGIGNYGSTLTVSKTGGINGPVYGIYSDFIGTRLFNHGNIHANEVAIELASPGTLNNSGMIYGTSFGVVMATGGAISYGTLFNSGTISAKSEYAVGFSEGGSVNNSGLITSKNAGVVLGTAVALSNSGHIYGKAFGVATRSDDSLVNTGTIFGGSNYAVGLREKSELTNQGEVHSSNIGVLIASATLTNTGSIAGQAIGVYLNTGVMTNHGSIHSGTVGLEVIGTSASGEFVTNTSKGVVSGGEFGVVLGGLAGQPVSMTNAGTIIGKVQGAYLYNAVLTNRGMIQGPIGVYLKSGELVDTGTISGTSLAVELAGAETLSLASAAALEGGVADLAGTGTIVLGESNKNTLAGIGSSVTGISDIVFINTATWTAEGNLAGLASGQTITNFSQFSDNNHTIVLTNFAAATGYYGVLGVESGGFTLSNGSTTHVITFAGYRNGISVYTQNGATYLISNPYANYEPIGFTAKPGTVSLISGFSRLSVTPGEGSDALGVTIGAKGTIDTTSAPAVLAPLNAKVTNVVNYGLIESSYRVATKNLHALKNFGTIIGNIGAYGIGFGAYNFNNLGVLLGDANVVSLNNTGTINGEVIASQLSNHGLISSSGSIAVWSSAVYLEAGSDIVGSNIGVYLLEKNSVGHNHGSIFGGSVGVALYRYPVFDNYGSVGGADGIHLEFGGTILNAGTISGSSYAIDASDSFSPYLIPSLHLIVERGAVFDGTVYDATGQGQLTLAGSTAGKLDMGISFIGFDAISFIGGSTWRLEGSVSELAGGQTISGFTVDDTLVLDGFAAISDTYVTGIGLELSNGSHMVTLDIAGSFSIGNFSVARGFGNTTITETSMVAALVGNVGSTL